MTTTHQFYQMEIGDTIVFPISKVTSVRALASTYSAMWSRKYSTATDKIGKVIKVTREQ